MRHRIRFAWKFAIAVIAIAPLVLRAQPPPAQKPSFEVASIKPNNSGSTISQTSIYDDQGKFSATNVTLKEVIRSCYRLLDYQVVGGPDWINTARFDFEAKAEATALTAPNLKPSETRSDVIAAMIQVLLEERFQLKAHRETRELPVFLLVEGRDGSKLQPTLEGRPGPGGLSAGSARSSGTPAGTEMSGSGISISRLINMLSGRVDRPVIDKTNLTGTYDFTLKFAPYGASPAGLDPVTEQIGPTVFTAIQEQLGLRLESGKSPVEVLVIDSVQKPSEN